MARTTKQVANENIEAPTKRLYNRLMLAGLAVVAVTGVIIVIGIIVPKGDAAPTKPETKPVTLAGQPFTLELALDDDQRARGLSGRANLADDGGMLFVFRDSKRRNFHMNDCLIPLDIIFVTKDGEITQIQTLPPPGDDGDIPKVRSVRPARYVIELKGGRAEAIGLKEGDIVTLERDWLMQHVR